MVGGIGEFITGFEELSFVEKLSDRFEMSPQSVVRALIAVAGVGLVVALLAFAVQGPWSKQETVEMETGALQVSEPLIKPSTEFAEDAQAATVPASETPAPQVVVVYVSGSVVNPGLYTLTSESRIGDAVGAAGGLLPDAAAAAVNLAQQVSDGMQVHIPSTNEVTQDAPSTSAASPASASPGSAPAVQSNEASSLININNAGLAELQTLKGIGPATAQKIIDYRAAHGSFQRKEDLKKVSGIGEKKYAALESYITV